MKNKSFINLYNLIFLILTCFLIFSRFYQIEKFFYFGVDEEYQALLSWSQIKNFHITWIGVSASDIGYYLGPGLTYLGAILLWLSKGNPISFAYFASFIGITTAISLYLITLKLYNFKTALISLFLYIFSPFALYYDRRYWPLAVPLIALWLFYSLFQSLKNSRWLFLTVFLIGLSYHIHITLWLFWPFIIFAFIYLFLKKNISLLTILVSIGIFVTVTLPLLVFDFLHNFDNLKLPLKLLSNFGQDHSSLQIIDRLTNCSLYFSKIFLISKSPNLLISAFLFISFIFLCVQLTISNRIINQKLIICILLFFFFGFIFFPSPMQEYYFVLPLPFVILLTAVILNRIKYFGHFILLIFFLVNTHSFITRPIYSDYQDKINIIKKLKSYVTNNDFELLIDGEYLYNGGWRYLFQANNLTPVASSADKYFSWIYPDEILSTKLKYKVIISKNKNLKLKTPILKRFSSGIYYAFVIPNP